MAGAKKSRSRSSTNSRNRRTALFAGAVKTQWLTTTIPLAEFLLLVTTLLIYLEVAPSDIPKRCSWGLQKKCLGVYGEAGGEFDPMFVESACGSLRVMCWRSGLKFMMYKGDIPENTFYLKGFNDELAANNLTSFIPMAELCQCMLTNNGTLSYPTSPDTFRSFTEYFCSELKSANAEMGVGGLILACLIITIRAHLDDVHKDSEGDLVAKESASIVAVWAIAWLGWSITVCVQTRNYALPSHAAKADCEIPAGNIFFYIYCLGCASICGSLYSLYISLRVIQKSEKLRNEAKIAKEARLRDEAVEQEERLFGGVGSRIDNASKNSTMWEKGRSSGHEGGNTDTQKQSEENPAFSPNPHAI
eukprot:m.208244 g.208244  ORF g.208244 m.208244 type:complete len:361 (-) comp18960_c0_seq4:343-1425(-)